jgi:hypothetical protein
VRKRGGRKRALGTRAPMATPNPMRARAITRGASPVIPMLGIVRVLSSCSLARRRDLARLTSVQQQKAAAWLRSATALRTHVTTRRSP